MVDGMQEQKEVVKELRRPTALKKLRLPKWGYFKHIEKLRKSLPQNTSVLQT